MSSFRKDLMAVVVILVEVVVIPSVVQAPSAKLGQLLFLVKEERKLLEALVAILEVITRAMLVL